MDGTLERFNGQKVKDWCYAPKRVNINYPFASTITSFHISGLLRKWNNLAKPPTP